MKRILVIILLLFSSYFLVKYGIDIWQIYMIPEVLAPPPPSIGVEAGPLKVVIDDNTPWELIIKAITTILSTYLGIKVINKYVK